MLYTYKKSVMGGVTVLGKYDYLEELDRIGNYLVKLKEISDKILKVSKKSTILEFYKYLDIIIERLFTMFNNILSLSYFGKGQLNEDFLYESLENNYILSGKSIEKIHYIKKIHKKFSMKEKYHRDFDYDEIKKIIDYLDDIIDDLSQYISLEK